MNALLGLMWICQSWSDAKQVGTLDRSFLKEVSGLAISRSFADRFYFHNDSGDGPAFYRTDSTGARPRKIKVGDGYEPQDIEDITIGDCGIGQKAGKSCLFLGDIGDNKMKRESVEIVVIEELQDFDARKGGVEPLKRLRVQYPDGPHNAEGLALHPNGDLYILTKEMPKPIPLPRPAKLFRIARADWQSNTGERILAQALGEIDFPLLGSDSLVRGQVVTGFDISPDGSKFIALTYDHAFEFNLDLSRMPLPATKDLVLGRDYGVARIPALPQQEAIAYTADGKGFYYTTESSLGSEQPLMRVDCRD